MNGLVEGAIRCRWILRDNAACPDQKGKNARDYTVPVISIYLRHDIRIAANEWRTNSSYHSR